MGTVREGRKVGNENQSPLGRCRDRICGGGFAYDGGSGPINWRHNVADNNASSPVTRSRDMEYGDRIREFGSVWRVYWPAGGAYCRFSISAHRAGSVDPPSRAPYSKKRAPRALSISEMTGTKQARQSVRISTQDDR